MSKSPLGTGLLYLVFGVLIAVVLLAGDPVNNVTPESEIFKAVAASPATVKHLHFEGNTVEVKMTDGTVKTSNLPDATDREELRKAARQHNIDFDSAKPSSGGFLAIVMALLPMILMGLLLVFILRLFMGGGGGMGQGFVKHKGKRVLPEQQKRVTFDDVKGQHEAKLELQEVVQFLRDPADFHEVGATIPAGALLIGPPGTGKTLLARAVAGEANVPFFSISGSEFIEMFVGVGAGRVRSLFAEVKAAAPAILFIDELDAVGRQRGAGVGGGNDEREQTINQILTELDGFSQNPPEKPIVVLAATNRPDVLDPALLRPGRFSRQVVVDRPDFHGRLDTFKLYLRNKPLADNVDLEFFAHATAGMSQADIANVCNEAAILAARRKDAQRKAQLAGSVEPIDPARITPHDIDSAIAKQQFGPERKSMVLTREQRMNTAVHESGHAIAHYEMSGGEIPRKITIVPTTRAAGYVQLLNKANQMTDTREELIAYIVMALAGRTSQMKILKACDTGASSDYKQAWTIARKMVAEWGMSNLGVIHAPIGEDHPFLGRTIAEAPSVSQKLLEEIDAETRRIITECQQRADEIIAKHEQHIRTMSELLLQRECILGPELKQILDDMTGGPTVVEKPADEQPE